MNRLNPIYFILYMIFIIVFTTCIIYSLLINYIYINDNNTNNKELLSYNLYNKSYNRLDEYCSVVIPKHKKIDSDYSNDNDNDNWSLIYLAITIRHGDRSSIHGIPNMKISNSNKKASYLLDDNVNLYKQNLNMFNLIPIKTNNNPHSILKGEDLTYSLDGNHAFQTSDYTLLPGQLTSRGFMQHIQLGSILNKEYQIKLLNQIKLFNQVYIRSTNYIRTIRSVAALVIGLFPHYLSHKNLKQPQLQQYNIPIHYYENEMEEHMHGIGEHGSSHSIKTSHSNNSLLQSKETESETITEGGCQRSVTLSKQQRELYKPTTSSSSNTKLMIKLNKYFGGNNIKNKTIMELFDASISSYCHGILLPCNYECLEKQDLIQMLLNSDSYYCNRYSGLYGEYATKLAMFPFLKEISEHITNAAIYHDKNIDKNSNNNKEKISIFSGHDTVIAPVLAVLGVYKQNPFCIWPGYASRIIIEVYSNNKYQSNNNNINNFSKNFGLYKLFNNSKIINLSKFNIKHKNNYLKTFIRILFNGYDITTLIPTCKDEIKKSYIHNDKLYTIYSQNKLCSLEAFNQQISSLLDPYHSLYDACNFK